MQLIHLWFFYVYPEVKLLCYLLHVLAPCMRHQTHTTFLTFTRLLLRKSPVLIKASVVACSCDDNDWELLYWLTWSHIQIVCFQNMYFPGKSRMFLSSTSARVIISGTHTSRVCDVVWLLNFCWTCTRISEQCVAEDKSHIACIYYNLTLMHVR
jgi:hypothetical protein